MPSNNIDPTLFPFLPPARRPSPSLLPSLRPSLSTNRFGRKVKCSQLQGVFDGPPNGSTPLTEAIAMALQDHQRENAMRGRTAAQTLQLIIVTDGEANNMQAFNQLLDAVQNGRSVGRPPGRACASTCPPERKEGQERTHESTRQCGCEWDGHSRRVLACLSVVARLH